MLVGQYHNKSSVNNTVDFHIDNAIINNSCIIINGYKCPLIFTTNSTKTTQYSRDIYVAIVIPSLQNEQETTNWIVNSSEGSTVLTKSITSEGITHEALLKDSIARVEMPALQRYGLTVVLLHIGGKEQPYSTMAQDEDPNGAYPPPATFNLQTFFGLYNVDTQDSLYAFWQKNSGKYLTWDNDNSTTGGGDGEYDDNSSDTIGLPDLTNLNQNSISNTKFLTCYKMTQAQLNKLGDELWSENFFHQLSNSVLKPTDFIVNLSLLPVAVDGVTKYIKAGKIYLNGAEGTLISQQFIRVDCGTLEVKKKWGGAIDYQTDVSIFLPFIGEESLNANEVIGASLNVIYTVDILSGSCIASIRVINDNLDAVLYQFTGNMASNYPITSADYSTVFASTLQVAIGETNIGNAGGVLSMVSATSNLLRGPAVKRTGSLSSTAGFMGIKKPYLILSRPIQSLPENYNSFHGYVSNVTMKLKDCKGYTQIDSIHIDNVPCMEEEKTRLLQILKDGIII